MRDPVQPYKSYTHIYTRIWLTLVLLLLITKFAGVSKAYLSTILLLYLVGSWLPTMALNLFEGYRFRRYLYQHHRETWNHITHVPGFGSGGRNSFRFLAFLDADDDLNDPVITWLKENQKKVLSLTLLIFLTYPIAIIVVMVF